MPELDLTFYAENATQALHAAVNSVLEAESIVGEYYCTRDRRWWKGFTPEREKPFIRHLENLIDTVQPWTWDSTERVIQSLAPHVRWTNVQPRIVGWETVKRQ